MESYWNDFFGEGGGACVAMERSLRRSSELLLADWYWFSRLPCADFWCPEGRRLIMLCYWKGTEKTSVGHKAFRNPFIGLLLRLCNDIETNPGPPNPPRRRSKPRRNPGSLQRQRSRTDEEASDSDRGRGRGRFRSGSETSTLRSDHPKNIESRHDILEEKVTLIEDQMEAQKTKSESTTKVVDNLVTRVNNIDGTVNDNEHGILHENSQMKEEIQRLKKTVKSYEDRFEEMEGEVQMKYFKDLQSIKNQMNELVCVYDDLQDRLYEIDRSWQNNLVFHGIKPDAGGVYESTDCLEAKIKGVLRTNLNIGREIPIVRLQRIFNGSDVRGYKPVIVNFQKWSDKEDVLRKAKIILKTSGIYVEEDFSRAAKFRRKELEKFAKEVRALSPDKKCVFKHDKLIIDDHVYIFNEQEHRIERLPSTISATTGLEDEVGDVPILTRRLKQKQSLTHANFNTNAKRAQSVESMLDRIPAVGTVTPHNHGSDAAGHHGGMSSSVSSYNVNSGGGYQSNSSPERKSKHRASSTVPANNETETDTDMEMAVDEQKSP